MSTTRSKVLGLVVGSAMTIAACGADLPDAGERLEAEEAVAAEVVRHLDEEGSVEDDVDDMSRSTESLGRQVGRVSFDEFGDDPPFFPEPTLLLERVVDRADFGERQGPVATDFLVGAADLFRGYQSTDEFQSSEPVFQRDRARLFLAIAIVIAIGGPTGEYHAQIAQRAEELDDLAVLFGLESYVGEFARQMRDGAG